MALKLKKIHTHFFTLFMSYQFIKISAFRMLFGYYMNFKLKFSNDLSIELLTILYPISILIFCNFLCERVFLLFKRKYNYLNHL